MGFGAKEPGADCAGKKYQMPLAPTYAVER